MFDLQGYGGILWQGTLMTIQLSLVSALFGLIFGLLGAAMKASKIKIFNYLATFYTTIVRGIPELLYVFFIFVAGDLLVKAAFKALGYTQYVELSAFLAGVFALSTMFGAYATEVFRMALEDIPKGQWEAADAVGMKPAQTFFRIIMPQMWAVAMPGLGNLFLVLLKDTALVSIIGLKDVIYYASRAAQSTQMPFTFYFVAALIYLVLTMVIMALVAFAEYWSRPALRYAKKQKRKGGA